MKDPPVQGTKIEVGSYAGYKANERPIYFVLEGRRLQVIEILDRWYGLEDDWFKILADDGRIYLIKWNRSLDTWLLVKVIERIGRH